MLAGTITDDLPSFVRLSHNQNTDDDDFHLLLGSSLRDIGDPKTADEDGTRTELGAYGASVSAQRYYQDQDRDGMYDGWEKSMGLSPTTADGGLDLDGDGMSNSNEHIRHTWANRPDSDGDGVSDGAEYSGGSDPLNWYARPSGTPNATEEKRVTATVPGDFSTLTAAVNAIQDRGEILIQPGQYQEQLLIRSKAVTLESASPGIFPILDWPYDTLLSLGGGELTLTGLTLTQEGCQSYAHPVSTSLRLMYASARLNDVRLEENCGSSGEYRTFGAAHFDQSDVVAQHFEAISSVGIGLSTTDSTVELEDCTIADNARAGLLADAFSDVSLYNCVVGGNRGSGIATNIPQFLTVRNSLIINNSSTNSGGGVYIPANGEKDTALFSHVLFAGNVSGYRGGGAYQYLSQVTYDHCVFTQNSAYKGDGGLSVAGSALTLVNVSNSILANNEGYNILISLGNDTPGDGLPRANISNSILYNPPGSLNYSLGNTPLNPSNLTDNPGFLEIDAQGVAVDYHLSLDSPAINRGNGTEVDLDGSLSDIGLYGGPGAASFDLDFDGRPDYFWPGGYSAVPTGVLGSDYDPDDRDPMR